LIPRGEQSGLQTGIVDDGKRFVVHADEILTAFLELQSAILRLSIGEHNHEDANHQRREGEDRAQDHGSVRPCRL